MFEKEEKELEKLNHLYQDLQIPSDFGDQAIMDGIRRAGKIKKRNRQMAKVFLTASIVFLGLVGSVKVSDTMAAFISNVPGIEKVVEVIRKDKGLVAAVDHDYIQKVGIVDSHDGLKVSLDSVIHDEKNLIAFYKYEAEDQNLDIFPKDIILKNSEGEKLPFQMKQGTLWTKNKESLLEIKFPLSSEIQLPENLILSFTFRLGSGEVLEKEWNFPVILDKDKFLEKEEVKLDKKVVVDGQEIMIKEITMYPTVTAVHVTYNSANSKKIFGFNDLQLVDENGEKWNPTPLETEQISENEAIFYLESHYFKKPKELYLTFNTIRALEKDELWVVIDPEKEKVLVSPKDGKITEVVMRNEELQIKLNEKPFAFKKEIFNTLDPIEGQNIMGSMGMSFSSSDHFILYSVPYTATEVQEPIKLKLIDYPATIQSKEEVRIKVK
ncbi:DUF4179 domain-containing protein [Neobacillus sp. D3-1R]|uniref:DUF4179 domain-containing protein n=1 Tax=Neobacillus sp. D3-1R TaxID=3445778 RepID=UPI003F9F761A